MIEPPDEAASSRVPAAGASRPRWPWVGAILALTALAYWPSLGNGLTNWDDNDYITNNPFMGTLSWQHLQLMFTTAFKGNYHPLSMLSLSLDHSIGGGAIRVHHLVNLLLHLANTGLVFLCVERLVGRREVALLTSLLFGVHPLHVESVAWISQRKDVLYVFFYLASLLAYTRYASGSPGRRARVHYGLSLGLFVLALLSKGMAVSLAPTLVAVDWLLQRRPFSQRALLEKLPFFALALVFGLEALAAQGGAGQLQGESAWSAAQRVVLAGHGYLQYLRLLIAPVGLSAFYPYPPAGSLPLHFYLSTAASVLLVAVGIHQRRRAPLLFFSFAFFTINIVLVLQLIPVGGAVMADRYSYLPSVGFFIALAVAVTGLAERGPGWRQAMTAGLVLYVGALSFGTYQRCEVWKDSLSLWNDTLARHPNIPTARLNRALARYESGDAAGAIEDLSVAIDLEPRNARAWSHRGVIRYMGGESQEALADLDRAVVLQPSADAYANRGAIRLALDQLPGAVLDFDRALQMNPQHTISYANRGLARSGLGQHRAALQDFQIAIALSPGYVQAHYGSGESRRALGEYAAALIDLDNALRLEPAHGEARSSRARVYIALGREVEGCADLREAARLGIETSQEDLERHCAD